MKQEEIESGLDKQGLKIVRPKKSGMYRFLYDGKDVTMEWMEFFSYMSEWQEEDCERLFDVHKKMVSQAVQEALAEAKEKILNAIRINEDKASRNQDIGDPQEVIRAEANGSIIALKWVLDILTEMEKAGE